MMTTRSRELGGWMPPGAAPGVGYGVRVLGLSPFQTEWYAANQPFVTSINGKSGAVTLVHTDISDWTTTLAPYALLNSPALVGAPTGPTAAPGTNSTQLATTAFVEAAVSGSVAGVATFNTRTGNVVLSNADVVAVLPPGTVAPVMNGVAAVGTSTQWAREDHVHPSDANMTIDCGTY